MFLFLTSISLSFPFINLFFFSISLSFRFPTMLLLYSSISFSFLFFCLASFSYFPNTTTQTQHSPYSYFPIPLSFLFFYLTSFSYLLNSPPSFPDGILTRRYGRRRRRRQRRSVVLHVASQDAEVVSLSLREAVDEGGHAAQVVDLEAPGHARPLVHAPLHCERRGESKVGVGCWVCVEGM